MRLNIGIYHTHLRAMGGGEKLTLALAEHLSANHNVSLFHAETPNVGNIEQFFEIDLSGVNITHLDPLSIGMRIMAKARGPRAPAFSLHHYHQLKKRNFDLFINATYMSGLACPAPRGILVCVFPPFAPAQPNGHRLPRRIRNALVDRIERQVTGCPETGVVHSYSRIMAISRYSAGWVEKIWGRQPDLVYPPCDDMGAASAKQKIILHVGRFVADNGERERHHKAQDTLLQTFKSMTELHRTGWQLHFAGSTPGDPDSAGFIGSLVESAKGFPVKFHFNARREELRNLFRSAAIYWHATGFGFDSKRYPARQEHFGITTVEAMSAGAVPVVLDSGGQQEIVTHGLDGFCWNDIPSLVDQTSRLVNDPELRLRLSRRAVGASERFGKRVFAERVDRLINDVIAGA